MSMIVTTRGRWVQEKGKRERGRNKPTPEHGKILIGSYLVPALGKI
jgi:hypothetical protein